MPDFRSARDPSPPYGEAFIVDAGDSSVPDQPAPAPMQRPPLSAGRRAAAALIAIAIFGFGIVVGRTSLRPQNSSGPPTSSGTTSPSSQGGTRPTAPSTVTTVATVPPPVGSCLGDPAGDETARVSCDLPHLQEVTAAFAASDSRHSNVLHHWDQYCADPSVTYLGLAAPAEAGVVPHDPAAWTLPSPNYGYNLVREPTATRAAGSGWLACVVRPQPRGPYVGSVRGVGSDADRPGAFGTCGDGPADLWLTGEPQGGCTAPHGWETIGQSPTATGWTLTSDGLLALSDNGPDVDQLERSCRRYAATVTGVDDPTYGGALQVGVELAPYQQPMRVSDTVTAASTPSDGATVGPTGQFGIDVALAACRIAPTDANQRLTESMIGWGERPPPLTST